MAARSLRAKIREAGRAQYGETFTMKGVSNDQLETLVDQGADAHVTGCLEHDPVVCEAKSATRCGIERAASIVVETEMATVDA